MQLLWFLIGLLVGLVLDFFLVVCLLRPIMARVAELERSNLCLHGRIQGEVAPEPDHN